MKLHDFQFEHIGSIEPVLANDGSIQIVLPQANYRNERNLALNRYGAGPFCKFKIPWTLSMSGVYAFVVSNEVKYIGECLNLSRRFNLGYGNISPRNCFKGGQETNCRINNLVYQNYFHRKTIDLWFHSTPEYKLVEGKLRAAILPEWNRI